MNQRNMDQLDAQQLLKDSTEVSCDSCGHNTFNAQLFMRKVSRLLTGQPKDMYFPIQTWACAKCGKVNKEFIPEGLAKSIIE